MFFNLIITNFIFAIKLILIINLIFAIKLISTITTNIDSAFPRYY